MPTDRALRFAVLGCGFWAQYQIASWRELAGADLVAVSDRSGDRAQQTARRFGVPRSHDDAETLLQHEQLDFVDIITNVETHGPLVELAARYGVAAVTQKPMAPDLETAQGMLDAARRAGVGLYVHENFRWQAPLRRLKAVLDSGVIGDVFRARLTFNSAFPVFDNQPALAQLEQFILTDVGTHVLDVARFLLGEARTLHAKTRRVNPAIKGEDVASVLMEMRSGAHCLVELSYASRLERESFPQTLVLVEGADGSVRLGLDGEIVTTTRRGVTRETVTSPFYDWADPAYAVAHSSIVDCNRNLLAALRGEGEAETTGEDNFQTLRLVYAAYDSAREGGVVTIFSKEDTS